MNARRLLPLSVIALAACTQQESVREIDWAKAALARNPNYEIVATDENRGVFTVRDTATGEVTTLKLKDLIAAPTPPREPARPAPAPTPAESPEVEAGALADNQTTEAVVAPGADEPASSGTSLAEGPGYRITRGTGDRPQAAAAALEGPGYRVEKSGGAIEHAQRQSNDAGADPQTASAEHRTDPIVCQGDRLMRIDGETLSFTGDAVIAEKGCDLYISNARIRAGGVGIIARQARVHIANSIISGQRGSYEVSDGAEIYVARSTFTGIGRRFDGASMTDLGGNSYATN